MRKRLLSILALAILVTSTLVGCSGASPADSTLTILSVNDGTVLVMKTGTDTWTEAEAGVSLAVGDTVKTGDDSGAEITFFDGSTIELEAGTQIEITSLDSSADSGATTITLMQTIGTSISRVTKLLDPASTYAVETPSGVAAVRGSTMIVRIVFDDPNYEDGTVLITSVEGDIWAIWQGVELQIPEGYICVIRFDQLLELVQLDGPPQADDDVTDGDTSDGQDEDPSNGQSDDQPPGGSATGNLTPPPMTPPPTIVYSDPNVFATPATPPADGETPLDGGTNATIQITISPGTGTPVFIWDDTTGGWAIDLDTGLEIDGEIPTSAHITVAADHHYFVWVYGDGITYDVKNSHGWTVTPAPAEYGGEQADGSPEPGDNQPLQFEKTGT